MTEEEQLEVNNLKARITAYNILLTSKTWGAAYGVCAKDYPDILAEIAEYKRIHNLIKG